MNIMLSYVAYPVTTAVYLERALRQLATVTTIGPRFPEELITAWKLENMKLPLYDHGGNPVGNAGSTAARSIYLGRIRRRS